MPFVRSELFTSAIHDIRSAERACRNSMGDRNVEARRGAIFPSSHRSRSRRGGLHLFHARSRNRRCRRLYRILLLCVFIASFYRRKFEDLEYVLRGPPVDCNSFEHFPQSGNNRDSKKRRAKFLSSCPNCLI